MPSYATYFGGVLFWPTLYYSSETEIANIICINKSTSTAPITR